MPERLFSAVRAAVQILAEEDYDGGRNDRERFVSRIIERLLTQFEDPASKMNQDDIDYLMAKLRQLADRAFAAREFGRGVPGRGRPFEAAPSPFALPDPPPHRAAPGGGRSPGGLRHPPHSGSPALSSKSRPAT